MKKRTFNHAMQEGVFFLLLGGGLLWYSLDAYDKSYIKDWAQSPSLFPALVSGLLMLFGVIILRQGLRERDGQAEKKAVGTVLIMLGMSLAYYLALAVIDMPYLALHAFSLTFTVSTFEVATVVFLAAMMAYLGVRSKRVLVFVPIGTSIFLSIMFRTLLRVLLP